MTNDRSRERGKRCEIACNNLHVWLLVGPLVIVVLAAVAVYWHSITTPRYLTERARTVPESRGGWQDVHHEEMNYEHDSRILNWVHANKNGYHLEMYVWNGSPTGFVDVQDKRGADKFNAIVRYDPAFRITEVDSCHPISRERREEVMTLADELLGAIREVSR